VSLTQIARILGVHQSTVSRDLDAALHLLQRSVRSRLRDDYGLDENEVKSIMRDVRSKLDLSLSRLLFEPS
jgi:hypothetical protein